MRFFVLVLTVLLSACAISTSNGNYVQTVSSWRWANVNSLLQNWGRPTKIGRLPNGDKVYIYQKESYRNYPPSPPTSNFATVSVASGKSFIVVPNPSQQQPMGPSYLLECTTTFEVDPHNIIVDVRATGNNCSGDEGFVVSRSNPHPLTPSNAPKKTVY